jgi:hypothetical protein
MSESLEEFLSGVRAARPVAFRDVIATIERYYEYRPTRFRNGQGDDAVVNEPGINEGSCKIFAFAHLNGLTEAETLALFGEYRDEVLADPGGDGHRNIRSFLKHGWAGIRFESEALVRKP